MSVQFIFGIKHSRPVVVRCKRQLNVSAPALHSGSNHSDDVQDVIPPLDGAIGDNLPEADAASSAGANTSQMNSKLDLIL